MSDMQEVHRLIVAQGEAWEQFRKKNDARFEALEEDSRAIQKKMARQFLAGGGTGGDGKHVSAEDREYKQAFIGWMRSGRESELQTKSMSSLDDPSGGYLVPAEIDNELSKVLRELSPMRQIARVVNSTSGDYSMLHSVGGTGYAWVGETSARPETNTPQFQKITPVIGEIYANPGLSQNVLDDSAFDLDSWIVEELTEAFDAGEGDAFMNGNGLNKPRGLLTYDIASTADGIRGNNALQYVATGASGDFASTNPADGLITLVHSLKPRYRKGAAWLMNTSTIEEVRKFKSADGQHYLWQPAIAAGQPDTLLGYPVYEDENMPDVTANSLSIAFGNFMRGYTIVDRGTAMLRDPFTNKPYVHFYSTRRVGGTVRDFRAVKLMKFAAS